MGIDEQIHYVGLYKREKREYCKTRYVLLVVMHGKKRFTTTGKRYILNIELR